MHTYLWSLYLTVSSHCHSWHLEQQTDREIDREKQTNRKGESKTGTYTWDTNSAGPYSIHPFFHSPLMIWNSGSDMRKSVCPTLNLKRPVAAMKTIVQPEKWRILPHPVMCVALQCRTLENEEQKTKHTFQFPSEQILKCNTKWWNPLNKKRWRQQT